MGGSACRSPAMGEGGTCALSLGARPGVAASPQPRVDALPLQTAVWFGGTACRGDMESLAGSASGSCQDRSSNGVLGLCAALPSCHHPRRATRPAGRIKRLSTTQELPEARMPEPQEGRQRALLEGRDEWSRPC